MFKINLLNNFYFTTEFSLLVCFDKLSNPTTKLIGGAGAKTPDLPPLSEASPAKRIFAGASFLIFVFCSFNALSSFDHSHKEFDKLLKQYVVSGRVDYKKWKEEQSELKKYLDSLSQVSISEYNQFSTNQQLAFLINAYNAFTIQLILKHYPVKGIKKIGGIFQSPWRIKFFQLLGEERHLDWIEHSKLRVDFQEPRIHFVIVCASIGCPILQREAYSADKLESQLEKATKEFLADKSKNFYDSKKKILYISPIFKWFRPDFEKKGSLVFFLQPYFSEHIPEDVSIEFTDYNWDLNEKK